MSLTQLNSVTIPQSQLRMIQQDVYHGRGSSKTLHRVGLGSQTLLYKVYRPDFPIGRSELEAVVRWRMDLPAADREYLDARSAFPRHIITDGVAITGICMQEAPDPFFFTPTNGSMRRSRTLDYLSITPSHALTVGDTYFQPPHKLAVLGDILELILWLHTRDVVVGDLNAENILVSAAPGEVKFIALDCDSLWVAGRSAMPKHQPPTMRCPWEPGDTFNRATDLYKFSLLSVRCLQEENAEPEPDRDYLGKIMPSDEVDCLLSLLDPQSSASVARLQALSRTWNRRMAPNGRLFGSNDKDIVYDWDLGSVRTPRSLSPKAKALVPTGRFPRGVLVGAGWSLLLAAVLALILVLALHWS
jgi:hypothetical protein